MDLTIIRNRSEPPPEYLSRINDPKFQQTDFEDLSTPEKLPMTSRYEITKKIQSRTG